MFMYSVCLHVYRGICLPSPTPRRFFLLSVLLLILNEVNGLLNYVGKKKIIIYREIEELKKKEGKNRTITLYKQSFSLLI